jgi:hypothetical protein
MATTIAVRLNAITGEFETAMKGATRTVTGFEKEFAGVASSVRGHQERMNAAFAAFSGDKIIAEANQLAAAVTKVGGASKLTEQEQRKVNAAVTEAIAKYQALGQTAPASLQALANATKQVEVPTTAASKALGALGGVFGQFTAANLAANAITAVIGKVSEFAAQGAKLPGLQSSFESLTRGIGANSSEMIASLQNATRGLVSNIDLMQSANKAILLGLPVTTKEMGDLAKTATVLGKAMGQDATKSLDDLITALGRSSPLILDNLGLSVKVGEANEKYAASLGKTVEALTDAEKKTAFYNAAMEAARAKVLELGEQTRTFGELVDSVWVNVGNTITQTVSDINVGIGAQIEGLLRLIPKTKEAGEAALEASKKEQSWSDEIKLSPLATGAAAVGLGAYVHNLELHAEAAKASADQQRIFNKLVADAPKPQDVFRLGGEGSRPNQFGTQPLDTGDTVKQWIQDQKDAEAAAKRAAEAMAAVDKKIVALIRGSRDLTVEQRRLADFFLDIGLSASEAAVKIGASEVAVAQFDREMRDLDKIMDKGIGSVLGLGESFKQVGQQVRLTDGIVSTWMVSMKGVSDFLGNLSNLGTKMPKFELPDPPPASAWEAQFLGLSDAAAQAAREAGIIWSLSFDTIAGHLRNLSRHFDNVFGDILSTVAEVAGAMSVMFDPTASALDKVMAGIDLAISLGKKLVGLFKDEEFEKVNDLRDDFLNQFGTGAFVGFNELAKQLNALGPAGDALFNRVINATKVDEFNRAMDDANAALDRAFAARPENQAAAAGFETIDQLRAKADAAVKVYEYVRDSGLYSADTIQKAWERANAALIASGDATALASDKARKAIDELDSKLKGLYNSIANEAPEEVMGVIESETRAKIAAIEEERKAAQSAIDAEVAAREEAGKTSTQQYKDDADEAYAYTKERFSEPLKVPVIWTYPNGGPVSTSTLNTSGGGSTPTVTPTVTVTPQAGTSTTIIELDGQVIAEATAPYVPGAARRYVGA